MFSDKMKARFAGLVLAGAALAAPGMASAGVVVKSSGPSAGQYPVGRQVADTATITLRNGDKITVLTDNGTSVLQGPGDFVVGQGATRTRSRFSSLSRRQASSSARTGAVRGAGTDAPPPPPEGPQAPPNLWYVNLGTSGAICLYDLDRVRLWRSTAESAENYTFVDQTAQTSFEVNFLGSEPTRVWDTETVPLVAGRSYAITGPIASGGEASAAPTTQVVSFVLLSENYTAQDQLAQALIDNGCTTQLVQLADELEAYVDEGAT